MPLRMHDVNQYCSDCQSTLKHVHCSHQACAFLLLVCAECDKLQAVGESIRDHEEDCAVVPQVQQQQRGAAA